MKRSKKKDKCCVLLILRDGYSFQKVLKTLKHLLDVFILSLNFLFVVNDLFSCHRFGIEGPVYLTTRAEKGSGEWYVDEQEQKIKKMDGSFSYSILQTVQIHLEVVEPQPNRPKLQLTLI